MSNTLDVSMTVAYFKQNDDPTYLIFPKMSTDIFQNAISNEWGCRGGEGLKTKCRPTFKTLEISLVLFFHYATYTHHKGIIKLQIYLMRDIG